MLRGKSAPRVKGPYTERGGTRFRIRICDETGRRDQYFPSLKEAQQVKRQLEHELPMQSQGRCVGDTLQVYYQEQVKRGKCMEETARHYQARLGRFLGPYLNQGFGKLTAKRAVVLYEQAVQTPRVKTGQPLAASTHRFYLKLAKSFFRWSVRKGFVASNPFAEVKPMGRPSRGKKQLRFEEASRFISSGLQLFDEHGDVMALAGVTALLLGCRASEVLNVRVRDLDCGGKKLWIAARDGEYRGKIGNAARNPDVPEVLQPRLLLLAEGKLADDYLFGVASTGRPRCRQTLNRAVHRICVAADVPVVCPHSLRGLWATASVRSGALSQAVAAALGHGSFTMTQRHYVEPGTIEGTRTEQLVKLLDLSSAQPVSRGADTTAEQLLASLPAETLTKLVALVNAGRLPKAKKPD